jgi:hypothetical protein
MSDKSSPAKLSKAAEYDLLDRVAAEASGAIQPTIPILLDPTLALMLVANLQLALRHPGNCGKSAEVARQVVDGIIARFEEMGYKAHAELARLGNDPEYDC